jgi:hypothetical protein
MAKRIAAKKKTGKATVEAKRSHRARRKIRAKEAYPMPYTLEPHPEL